MRTIIVANAPNLDISPYLGLIDEAALLIAADGGARALMRQGIYPQIVIGDLDSLTADDQAILLEHGVELQRFPRAKDETDLELALLEAARRGAQVIDVVGALGGRWDHTFANVALLALPALADRKVRLLDDRQELFVVRDQAEISGKVGDTVSLLPLSVEARGVTTQGLQYPLHEATLHYEQARGVSNVLLEVPARVTLRSGLLLVVHHDDGGQYQWNTNPDGA
jgi:thiamine pyrophosphokinase